VEKRVQETIQTLVGGLAHEIKTPLSTVGMNLQLLREMLEGEAGLSTLDRRVLDKVILVEKEVQRLGEVLNEFLRFIRERPMDKKPGSINLLVTELLDFLLPEAEAFGIRVHRDLDYRIPLFLFDFELIRQAALNVLKNAIEAMRSGGDLHVETRQQRGEVLVCVANSGPPIPAEDRAKIFEPYYSTKPEGTGLGLSAAKRAFEEHGGNVEVEDRQPGGVRFLLRLPMDDKSGPGSPRKARKGWIHG